MNIGRICNREVVIALASDPLSRVARQMCDQHVGMVVVVEERADKRVPVGIVTDRDIVRAQLQRSTDLFCLSVAQAMTANPLTLLESESMVDAIGRLRARGVRRAPVVEAGGALVGVVAMDDLLAAVSEELSGLSGLAASQPERER
jgi:CBS domain-containing protein